MRFGSEAFRSFLVTLLPKNGSREIWFKYGHGKFFVGDWQESGHFPLYATKKTGEAASTRVKTEKVTEDAYAYLRDLSEAALEPNEDGELPSGGIFYLPTQPQGHAGKEACDSTDDLPCEMDAGTQAEQLAKWQEFTRITGLIPASLLSSGGKSIHGHIKLTEHYPIEQADYLRRLFILGMNGDHIVVSNRTQPMRIPGFFRVEKGAEQTLLFSSNARYTYDRVLEGLTVWFAHIGYPMPDRISDDWWSELKPALKLAEKESDQELLEYLNQGIDAWEENERLKEEQKLKEREARKAQRIANGTQSSDLLKAFENCVNNADSSDFDLRDHGWIGNHKKVRGFCTFHAGTTKSAFLSEHHGKYFFHCPTCLSKKGESLDLFTYWLSDLKGQIVTDYPKGKEWVELAKEFLADHGVVYEEPERTITQKITAASADGSTVEESIEIPYTKEAWIAAKNQSEYDAYRETAEAPLEFDEWLKQKKEAWRDAQIQAEYTDYCKTVEKPLKFKKWLKQRSTVWAQGQGFEEWKQARKFTPNQTINQPFIDLSTPEVGTIVILKSGLNTRKTQYATDTIAKSENGFNAILPTNFLALQFGSRASKSLWEHKPYQHGLELVEEASKLNPDTYKTVHLRSDEVRKALRTVGCPDSICKLSHKQLKGKPFIVDEVDAVHEAFLSRDTAIKRNRSEAQERYAYALQKCSYALLMSGTASDIDVNLVKALAPNKKIIVIENIHKPVQQKFIRHAAGSGTLSKELDRTISNREPFIVLADNAQKLEALHQTLQEKKLNGYCLTASSQNEPWAKSLTDDADLFFEKNKVDYFLASPTIGSGFSCNIEGYFKAQFTPFVGHNLTNGQKQFLIRFRDPEIIRHYETPSTAKDRSQVSLKLTASEAMQDIISSLEEYASSALEGEALSSLEAKVMNLIKDFRKNAFTKALSESTAVENFERRNLDLCLKHALEQEGHKVEDYKVSDDQSSDEISELEADVKTCREIQEIERFNKVAAAKLIDQEEEETITSTMNPTPEQRIAKERYSLEMRFPEIGNTDSWKENGGAFIRQIRDENLGEKATRYYLFQNPEVIQPRQRKKIVKWVNQNAIDINDIKRDDTMMIQALQHESFKQLISLKKVSKDSPELKAFIDYCTPKIQDKLKTQIGKSSPMRFFGRVIEKLGFQTERVKDGGKWVYEVSNIWESNAAARDILRCVEQRFKNSLSDPENDAEKTAQNFDSKTAESLAQYDFESEHEPYVYIRENIGSCSDDFDYSEANYQAFIRDLGLTEPQRKALESLQAELAKSNYAHEEVEKARSFLPRKLWSLLESPLATA
ncbi:hypothetical protein H6F51_21360 [Cyanobacteria bacterium FACHB-DQ100]|nr:hypothetical protein [Cyanobacteria bacterium FACHB-DQ100]